MRGMNVLAVLAAAFLAFSWQPALAQYDDDEGPGEYEQQQEHSECVDAVAANMGDPQAMTRIGFSSGNAEFVAKVYDKIQENFANLVIMQRYINNLDMIKPILAEKKDSKARKIIEDIQANVRNQMEQLRGQLIAMSDVMLNWASSRCKRIQNTARRREGPPVNIGIGLGVGVGLSDGDDRRRHHGGKKKKGGDTNSQQQQGGENHPHPGCGPN